MRYVVLYQTLFPFYAVHTKEKSPKTTDKKKTF